MQELIGKTIGQYQIIEQIGKGGMATIFKAYQPSIDRYVAIKVLPQEFARDPNFVKRFAQEAKAIAALEHSHILPVHDFGTQDTINYMVMRYVPSGTLSDIMGTKVPLKKVAKYVGDVARALDYAHSRGVVHRDIKPSNILIDDQGNVLLTDFGIAKIVEGSEGTQLTAAGSILGTPAYMSPEQAQSTNIDGRSDIYSLGVVLYELLTGQPPFQAETPFAVVIKHLHDPLPPPRSLDSTIPEAFERVVLKAMAKNPADRFATAGAMADALDNALRQSHAQAAQTPSPLPTTEPPERETVQLRSSPGTITDAPAPPAKKSNRTLWMVGVVVALLACVTLGCFVLLLGAAKNNADQTPTAAVSGLQLEDSSTREAGEVGLPGDNAPTATDTPAEPSPTPESTATPTEPAATTEPEPTDTVATETDEATPNSYAPVSGDVLFEDDFSTNDNEWPEEYHEDDLGYYDSYLTEEKDYVVVVNSASEDGHVVWFEPTMDPLTDFVYTVEAAAETEAKSYLYGVVFRSAEDGSAYFFEMDFEGFGVSMIDENEDWTQLVEYTYSDAVKPDEFNELRVEAVGSQFTFYINGEEVATLEEDSIPEGTLGVVAEVFEADGEIIATFDNVEVVAP